MTPAERMALGLGAAAIVGGAIVVATRMLIEIWRERREMSVPLAEYHGCPIVPVVEQFAQDRVLVLSAAGELLGGIVGLDDPEWPPAFVGPNEFPLRVVQMPYDWRADRAFSASGRKPR